MNSIHGKIDIPSAEPTSRVFIAQMASKDFKVAIVGGGLCGLACAIALLKDGVDVDVYEAAVSTYPA